METGRWPAPTPFISARFSLPSESSVAPSTEGSSQSLTFIGPENTVSPANLRVVNGGPLVRSSRDLRRNPTVFATVSGPVISRHVGRASARLCPLLRPPTPTTTAHRGAPVYAPALLTEGREHLLTWRGCVGDFTGVGLV